MSTTSKRRFDATNALAVSEGLESTLLAVAGDIQVNLFELSTDLFNEDGFTEDGDAVIIDPNIAVSDTELDAANGGAGDYDGATLTVMRTGGANTDDAFSFAAMSNVTVSGSELQAGGVTIATVTNSGGTLSVSFTNANGASPTTALINEIATALQYANTSDNPPASVELDVTINDGEKATTESLFHCHYPGQRPAGSDRRPYRYGGRRRSYLLTAEDLGFIDPDDDTAGVTFTVSDPVNGVVLVNGAQATSFTAQQVIDDEVAFQHDGSETNAASFDVTIDDGNEDASPPPDPQTFSLSVTPSNDAPILQSALRAGFPTNLNDQLAGLGVDVQGSLSGTFAKVDGSPHGFLASQILDPLDTTPPIGDFVVGNDFARLVGSLNSSNDGTGTINDLEPALEDLAFAPLRTLRCRMR